MRFYHPSVCVILGLGGGLAAAAAAAADTDLAPSAPSDTSGTAQMQRETKAKERAFMGWLFGGPWGECEGNCLTDADCQGELKCFQRTLTNMGDDVPGCHAASDESVLVSLFANFCYSAAEEPSDEDEDLLKELTAEIDATINSESTLAANYVRLGFHDCVGGCDGCIDMKNADNKGLEKSLDALEPICGKYKGTKITMADCIALAALRGAYLAQPDNSEKREFVMEWIGRPTCEDMNEVCKDENGNEVTCTTRRGPHREMPSSNLTTHDLLAWFKEHFDFGKKETVAIMGAHAIGTLSPSNSGFHGPLGWTFSNVLDSGFYRSLLTGLTKDIQQLDLSPMEEEKSDGNNSSEALDFANWAQQCYDNSEFGTPDKCEWERGIDRTGVHVVMLNADMALAKDLNGYIDGKRGLVTRCTIRYVWICSLLSMMTNIDIGLS